MTYPHSELEDRLRDMVGEAAPTASAARVDWVQVPAAVRQLVDRDVDEDR